MALHIVYVAYGRMYNWKEYAFCSCSGLYMSVRFSWLIQFLYLYWYFYLGVSTTEAEVLTTYTVFEELSISPLSALNFLHVFWDTIIKCIYFKIVIFSWWIAPLIIMQDLSLSLARSFVMKLTDTEISSLIFFCLWFSWYHCVFVYPLIFSLSVLLKISSKGSI